MDTPPPAPASLEKHSSYNFAMAAGIISIGLFLLAGIITLASMAACSGVYECGLGWLVILLLFVYFVFVAPVLVILTIIGIVVSARLTVKKGVCLALNITGLSLNLLAGLTLLISLVRPFS